MNELLRMALELGLPAEAVNQAGAFFLRELPGWRDELVVHHRGTSAIVLVPNTTLYLLSKLGPLSASDLGDCLAMLSFARDRGQDADRARIGAAIAALRTTAPSPERNGRLDDLTRALLA
jgi:hypothetical protein